MAASDAIPVPRKNVAFRAYFGLRYRDGDLDIDWINPSGFISQDGAAWINATNSPTEIPTPKRGAGYLDLTASEMNCDGMVLMLENTHPSSMPLMLTFYPESVGDYRIDTPDGISDVNVVQVSGIPVGISETVPSNVVQVSGENVSIEDFHATGFSTHSAADVDTELTSVHGAGSWQTGDSTDSGVIAQTVWEYSSRALSTQDWSTHDAADVDTELTSSHGAGSWQTGAGADSGVVAQAVWEYATRALSVQDWSTHDAADVDTELTSSHGAGSWQTGSAGGSGDIAQAVWEYSIRGLTEAVSVSGVPEVNTVEVSGVRVSFEDYVEMNVIQVSGDYVSIEDFHGPTSSSSDIANAVWDANVGDYQTFGKMGYALNVASGNIISGDWSTHSAADVDTELTSNHGAGSWQTGAGADSGVVAQTVWEYATRTLSTQDWSTFDHTSDTVIVGQMNVGVAVSSIPDVNVIQVSGIPVGISETVPSNVIQVSGEYVSIEDFHGDGAFDPNTDTVIVGQMNVGVALSSVPDVNIIQVSGDWVSIEDFHATGFSTHNAADVDTELTTQHGAGSWQTGNAGSSGDIAQSVWEYVTRTLTTQDWSTFDPTTDEVIVGQMNVGVALSSIADVNVVQVSGEWIGYEPILDANVVQVSGEWVGFDPTIDANVIQVSGEYVSIEDFSGSVSAGAIADQVWNELVGNHQTIGTMGYALNIASGTFDEVYGIKGTSWDIATDNLEDIYDKNVAIQTATGNIYTAVLNNTAKLSGVRDQVVDISGVVDTMEQDIKDYGDLNWTTSASGDIAQTVWEYANRTLTSFPSGAFAEAVWTQYTPRDVSSVNASGATPQEIWEYASRTLNGIVDANVVQVSGIPVGISEVVPANIIQVSGDYVSIEDFRGGIVSVSGIVDANIVQVSGEYIGIEDFYGGVGSGIYDVNVIYISGVPVGIDSESVADSDEITTVGNLLLNRARIIRLLP